MKMSFEEECKQIVKGYAEELEQYASREYFEYEGNLYPVCADDDFWNTQGDETYYNEVDGVYVINGETVDGLETVGIYDYFAKNDIYNIEYRVDERKEYKNVEIMLACGGPNIYLDTGKAEISLYWGNTVASYPISYDVNAAIDDYFEEFYNCL